MKKYPGIKIKTFEKFGHAVIDLANNGIDALVGDSVQVNYFLKNNKDLMGEARFMGSRMTSEFYGIVIRKEDKQLKSKIDASLTRLLQNGTIDKLHQNGNWASSQWFPIRTYNSKLLGSLQCIL